MRRKLVLSMIALLFILMVLLSACNWYYPTEDKYFFTTLETMAYLFTGDDNFFINPVNESKYKFEFNVKFDDKCGEFGYRKFIYPRDIYYQRPVMTVSYDKGRLVVSDRTFTIAEREFAVNMWKGRSLTYADLSKNKIYKESLFFAEDIYDMAKQYCGADENNSMSLAGIKVRLFCKFDYPVAYRIFEAFYKAQDIVEVTHALSITGVEENDPIMFLNPTYIDESTHRLLYLKNHHESTRVLLESGLFGVNLNLSKSLEYVQNHPDYYAGFVCEVELPQVSQFFRRAGLTDWNGIDIFKVEFIDY